ncbi:MAG: hypothetical protein GW858_01355 [Sphingomonadales bacterium]|nr:hypothetical protein [Sphingomonadales bacterium]NCQ22738.1 hypothetical protein [Sphingomonadales bacterium]
MDLVRRLALIAVTTSGVAASAHVNQNHDERENDRATDSRIDAPQIEMSDSSAVARQGRAYLDSGGRLRTPHPAQATQANNDQIARGDSNTPTSQVSVQGQGGPAISQLSRADLASTLAQLTLAERRVLLQAIEGSDICDTPPDIPAILALCRGRIETRAAEFASPVAPVLSAEDSLLRGDLESTTLPSIAQVIDRLARGSASSEDFSNQAIASIALGATPAVREGLREEEQANPASLGEETQALINALINQLGGRAP